MKFYAYSYKKVIVHPYTDSAQANFAGSQTLRRLTLRGVKQIFQIFENLQFQGISDPYDDISKKLNIFRKSKIGQHCAESTIKFSEDPKVT